MTIKERLRKLEEIKELLQDIQKTDEFNHFEYVITCGCAHLENRYTPPGLDVIEGLIDKTIDAVKLHLEIKDLK
jgi:hypothetical protein